MSGWNDERVWDVLRTVKVPGMERDIVDYGVVLSAKFDEGQAIVELEVLARDNELPEQIRASVEQVLKDKCLTPVINMQVRNFPSVGSNPGAVTPPPAGAGMGPHGTSPDPWADRQRIDGVDLVIAVASGKGGVGKSTVASNLALALKFQGMTVGLMDADIYGPSQPIMMGIKDIEVLADDQRRIYPVEAHGIKTISIGYLLQDDQPVIWRGPMVMKTIEQFLRGVNWGKLDVLVIDLPPGTGDAQLSLVQKTPIDGAVIVTTPQDVALADVIRGHAMFEKVGVPTLGVIENMSYFICPNCDEKHELFASGGGKEAAEERGLPFLGSLPLDPAIRQAADQGAPIVVADPSSPQTTVFQEIALKVLERAKAVASA